MATPVRRERAPRHSRRPRVERPNDKAREQLARALADAGEAAFRETGAVDIADVVRRLGPVHQDVIKACSPEQLEKVAADWRAISQSRPSMQKARRAVLMRRRLHAVLGEAHALLGFASDTLLHGYPEEEWPDRRADIKQAQESLLAMKCSIPDHDAPPAPEKRATQGGDPAFVEAALTAAVEARMFQGAKESVALSAARLSTDLLANRRHRGKVCSSCGATGEVGEHVEHRGAIVCVDCLPAAMACEVCKSGRGELVTASGRQLCHWCYVFDDVLKETPPAR